MRMIALVSDQRMQNILPLLQQGSQYRELILVMSKERGTGKPAQRFIKATNDIADVVAHVRPNMYVSVCCHFFDPYDIDEIRALIECLIVSGEQQVVVNMSGGTKPMAIGALQAAQQTGIACVYTNTENNELIWIMPNAAVHTEAFNLMDLDVSAYLRAYGDRVESCTVFNDINAETVAWADTLLDHYEVLYKAVIVKVMRALSDRSGGYPISVALAPTRRQKNIIATLAHQSLWEWNEGRSEIVVHHQRQADFICGGWVELCVACQLHRSSAFHNICLNIKLHDIDGDIDVAVISGARLILIECKSNLKETNQLNTLLGFKNKLGGPFAHAYYARAADDNKPNIMKKSNKLRLNGVFCGTELRTLAQEIEHKLREA